MFPALREHRKPLLALGALCTVLFAFNLGAYGLLDPDEPFYALTAKEMLAAHNWLVPTIFGEPQFEKPILFYWLEMASFKVFGLSEWVARLAPCLAGFAAVFATYAWAQVLFRDKKTSFLSALILATAAQYVVCTRVVLTDMVFTFFVVATWLSFSMKRERWGYFFSVLGALTKGPLGFMIPFMSILTKKSGTRFRGVWVFFLIAAPWYAYMTWRFGGDFLYQFFIHENVRRFFVAEHKGLDRIFLYPLGFMGGFFPWSVFMPAALVYGLKQGLRGRSRTQRALLFLSLSFWLPFFFFTAAKSKLLSYTFPLYPVLAVLIGAWTARFMRSIAMKFPIRAALWPWAVAVWGIFPPALIAAAFIYAKKNDPAILAPVIAVGCILVPFSWAAIVLVWRRTLKAAVLSLTAMMAVFSVIAFSWLLPSATDLFSSREWAEWYRESLGGRPGSVLVASKLNVRGMSFYTGEDDMAVVSGKAGRTFYTPHALSILASEEAFLNIPKKEYPVYGCLRHKELKFLRGILGSRFQIEMVRQNPQLALVRIRRTDGVS